jgi:hypothetical protein
MREVFRFKHFQELGTKQKNSGEHWIILQESHWTALAAHPFLMCSSQMKNWVIDETKERICLKRKESSTILYVEKGDLSSAHSVCYPISGEFCTGLSVSIDFG